MLFPSLLSQPGSGKEETNTGGCYKVGKEVRSRKQNGKRVEKLDLE